MRLGKSYTTSSHPTSPGPEGSKDTMVVAVRCNQLTLFCFLSRTAFSHLNQFKSGAKIRILMILSTLFQSAAIAEPSKMKGSTDSTEPNTRILSAPPTITRTGAPALFWDSAST